MEDLNITEIQTLDHKIKTSLSFIVLTEHIPIHLDLEREGVDNLYCTHIKQRAHAILVNRYKHAGEIFLLQIVYIDFERFLNLFFISINYKSS